MRVMTMMTMTTPVRKQMQATIPQVMIRQEPHAVQMEPQANLYQGGMLHGRGQDLSMQVLVDGVVIQATISVLIPPPVPAMIAPVKSMMGLGKEPPTAVPVRSQL